MKSRAPGYRIGVVLLSVVLLGADAGAAVVPVGDETVLATSDGVHFDPKRVVRAADRFAVVHADSSTVSAGAGAVVLRYFQPGTSVSSEPVEVTTFGAHPRVAAFPDGSVVVAWTDFEEWFVRFFDATGVATTDALPVVSVVASNLAIVAGSEGDWAIVYDRYVPLTFSWELVGLRFNGTQQLSEEPFLISATGLGEPAPAMNQDDELFVTWKESREYEECENCGDLCCEDPEFTFLWGRAYDGDSAGDATRLAEDFYVDEQGRNGHDLAVAGQGFLGAWLDGVDTRGEHSPEYLVMRAFDDAGSPAAASRVLAGIERGARYLSLALASEQAVIALSQPRVFDGEPQTFDFDFSLFSTAIADGPVLRLDLASVGYPYDFAAELAGGDDGYLLVVWERREGAPTTVQILAQPYFAADEILCGDADLGGDVSASDALGALRAAVGSRFCALAVCDSNGDGSVSASDASRTLRSSVGQEFPMDCPASGSVVPPPLENP